MISKPKQNPFSVAPFCLLPLATLFVLLVGLPAQEPIREYVRVVNVEILVRVSEHGKPKAGLKKSDFRLTVNGQPTEINGFAEFRRTMAPAGDAGSTATSPCEPRLFILYLWVFEQEVETGSALDRFFSAIYRPGDRVLLVSPRRVYEVARPEEIVPRRRLLAADLQQMADLVRESRRRSLRPTLPGAAEHDAAEAGDLQLAFGAGMPIELNCEESLRGFAETLKKIEQEKWVVVFCQRGTAGFSTLSALDSRLMAGASPDGASPRGKIPDPATAVPLLFEFLKNSVQGHTPTMRFDRKTVRELFIQSGVTFHLAVLGSRTKGSFGSEAMHLEELNTGWQDVFAEISAATGGTAVRDVAPVEALDRFAGQEDRFYSLTYAPGRGADEPRQIRVEIPGGDYELHYHHGRKLRAVARFSIDNLCWQEPQLSFQLHNYLLEARPDGPGGRVTVAVRATPASGEGFSFAREVLLPEKHPQVELRLRLPAAGRYRVSIEALDRFSGEQANAEQEIEWRGPPAPDGGPDDTTW